MPRIFVLQLAAEWRYNVKVPFTLADLIARAKFSSLRSETHMGIGIRDSNTCAQCLLNFRLLALSGFARRQPCFTLQEQPIKNFSAHWVFELKKSKFFERKGKSAVNSYSINEHFNAILRKICLFKPYAVRISYANNLLSFLALSIRDLIVSCRHRAAEWRLL